ncbi:hypothetical protein KKH56_01220 [bacterium]|nr:hypothetical protein [bacterium]
MAKKVKLSQEEEIIKILKQEGFRELTEKEIKKEPYKSIAKAPLCFKKAKESAHL